MGVFWYFIDNKGKEYFTGKAGEVNYSSIVKKHGKVLLYNDSDSTAVMLTKTLAKKLDKYYSDRNSSLKYIFEFVKPCDTHKGYVWKKDKCLKKNKNNYIFLPPL